MKINPENIGILFRILSAWVSSVYRIKTYRSLEYIKTSGQGPGRPDPLTEREWTMIRKAVKGIRYLSPLFLKRRRCLMEALILNRYLYRMGVDSRLHLGARKENGNVSTHAWVSVGYRTLIGGPVTGYEELVRTR
jgi:hypothetical protein